jgi:glucokinase
VILAGDVGATKILLEVGEMRSGRWQTALARRYETHDAVNFPDVLHEFLGEWESAKSPGQKLEAAAFGVAGVAEGNRVKMTLRPWTVDGDLIARRFAIPKVRTVNDLYATAHGIDRLDPGDLMALQPGMAEKDAPRVVLGVGTGLGISYRVAIDGDLHEIASEGGHANFGPANLMQARLWSEIFATHGRVSAEDVVSGRGLQHIYAFTNGIGAHRAGTHELPSPEEITQGAIQEGHEKFTKALDLFSECLGNVAGDHALCVMARGGVYLAGGVIAKVASWLDTPHFRAAFCGKAPHSALLMRIPVFAVKSERTALLGAARLALEA